MAGLIPQTFIDDLLSRADIVDVVDKRVKLRKTGKNYSGLCPFHQEKSPSFSVEPDKQFYYCFGCGAGGNAIGFLMNFDNLDFPQAVEALAADLGLDVPREATSRTEQVRQSRAALMLAQLDQANRFYQAQLRQHDNRQAAVDYLKARGLSGTIARDFMLGYAPPGWDNLLARLGDTEEARKLLLDAGLIISREARNDNRSDAATGRSGAEEAGPDSDAASREDASEPGYYDRFRNRIMFPIRNSRGQVVGFGGRVLGDDKPKYLNSPETAVFHKGRELYGLFEARRANKRLDRVIIVEGYMDVIALAQSGIHNAVATLGTACSASHLQRLFRLVNEVVFCFDGDDAGRNAAWRALQVSIPQMEDGREVNFLFLPEGEDPDSLVRQIGTDRFNQRVANAVPLADYFFDKLSADLDLDDIADRARLGQLARPLLKQFPKGLFGQLMRDRLAELVGVSKSELNSLMGSEQDAAGGNQAAEAPEHLQEWPRRGTSAGRPPEKSPPGRKKSWSLKAIELILAKPEIALTLDEDLSPLADLDGDNSRMLLDLVELVRGDPDISTYAMLGYFYDSPVGNRLTRLLRDEKITPRDGIENEFRQIIDRVLSDVRKKADIDKTLQTLRNRLGNRPDPGETS